MESCTPLRTLNFLSPLHHFRSGVSLICPFLFPKLKNKPSLSISSSAAPHNLHCISKKGDVNSLPRGAGEAFTEVTQDRLLQVVLVSPQDFAYRRGDWLVFGSGTSGLPPEALFDCHNEILGGGTIRIPMIDTYVRCLNLSISAGIAVYEASRQLNYEQLEIPAETCIDDTKESFITVDIFA